MIREIRRLVSKRKSEECITVEMNLACVQAACVFYRFEIYKFLESGYELNENSYEVEGLSNSNHNFVKLYLALRFYKKIK